MRRLFAGFLPILLLAAPAIAQQCGPSPEVGAALDNLPLQQASETDWQYLQSRRNALQELMRRFPGDVFIERLYIGMPPESRAAREKMVSDYKDRHEKNPGDARLTYLYGLSLVNRDSRESIRLFDAALTSNPDFAPPHLKLVSIYNSPNFKNKELALQHLKAFLEACPESFDGYSPLNTVNDQDLIASYSSRLRQILAKRSDMDAIGAYQTLWSLEFKTRKPSEYPALRKQVAQDLERIRGLKLEDRWQWYAALQQGYKLVNDQKQVDWANDERDRRFPSPFLAAYGKWQTDHKSPADDDPPDKRHAYYTALLKESDLWLKERPGNMFVWRSRVDAMLHLDDVPAADVKAATAEYIKRADANAGPKGASPYECFLAGDVLAKRHLEPERRLELAKKGLAHPFLSSPEPYPDLYATKDNLAESDFYQCVDGVHGAKLEAGAYLDLKQLEKARAALVRVDERLRSLEKLAGGKQEYRKEYSGQMSAYWGLMARAAELGDHPQDAMAFYENALLARFDAQQKPEPGVKDELAGNANQLWTKLGGTAEGWQLWYGQRAQALASQATLTWEDANQPLPSFEIADLGGKTWNLASLKGKVTFLNFWASW